MKILDLIKRKHRLVSMLIMFFSLAPFITISVYSRPCADDYGYSYQLYHMVQKNGINIFQLLKKAFEVDIQFYNSWQGLYSSAFLLSLQPGIFGNHYYFIGAISLMIMTFVVFCICSSLIQKAFDFKINTIFSGLIITTMILQGIPSIVQGIYWYNGAMNYIPFVLLTLLNSCLIINYIFAEKDIKKVIISIVVSFVISGGNHLTSFMNILLLLLLSIYCLIKRRDKVSVIYSLLFAIVGFLVMLNAPGTKVRESVVQGKGVIETMLKSAVRCVSNTINYMNIRWAAFLLLLIPIVLVLRKSKKFNSIDIHPVLLFLMLSMVNCGVLCVPYYAIGSFGSGRAKNVYYYIFVIFSSILFVYTLVWLGSRSKRIEKILDYLSNRNYGFPIIVFCLIISFYRSNFYYVMDDLISGKAKRFADQYEERYRMMESCEPSEILVFEELVDCKTLKFDDISSNLEDWRNEDWYNYYGIKAVTKKKD